MSATAANVFLQSLLSNCLSCHLERSRILIAVSGGADSVALLRGMLLLRETLECDFRIAHLNHQLRGDQSSQDAIWVRELCERLNVPCHLDARDVLAMPELTKHGLEGTARIARRTFLQEVARQNACTSIALAHTSDDQVETILHQIVRGTGLRGLAGMSLIEPQPAREYSQPEQPDSDRGSGGCVRRVPFVRPILSLSRSQVEGFLAELGQEFRTDQTNHDLRMTRNRIRHSLLPLLEQEYNPRVRQAILQLGQQASEICADELALTQQVLRSALIEAAPTYCRLLCSELNKHSRNRVRECLVNLWRQQNWPRQKMGFREWNCLAELIGGLSGSMNLPGNIRALRRNDLLIITTRAGSSPSSDPLEGNAPKLTGE